MLGFEKERQHTDLVDIRSRGEFQTHLLNFLSLFLYFYLTFLLSSDINTAAANKGGKIRHKQLITIALNTDPGSGSRKFIINIPNPIPADAINIAPANKMVPLLNSVRVNVLLPEAFLV